MLRTEFRFPIRSRPQRALAFLLGESFLGFLALVAVALTLFPVFFPVTPAHESAINKAQWAIIAWFAFEYAFALASSRDKPAFLLNSWRLVDLATVLLPLASLFPWASSALLSSPALRLVRLVRLVSLGVRVSGITARRRVHAPEDAPTGGPSAVTRMARSPGFAPEASSWDEFLQWLRAPGADWYHLSNLSREQLAVAARTAGLPAGFLETQLLDTGYPHLTVTKQFTALFLWIPTMRENGDVERHGVLFLARGHTLVSFARQSHRTIEKIAGPTAEPDDDIAEVPFPSRMLGLVLQQVVHRNERLVGHFEQGLQGLEEVPVRESGAPFFERAFRLKKELSATQADLWRLKGVLADLASGRALPGKTEKATEAFSRLSTDLEYLYETVVNVRDEVLSVIELHLNIVSFDMNRVMRVLAVVSVLGLIPAVIGGLFGMNLVDNPWPFTLPQVAFLVGCGMVLCLYFFFVKGWLR